MPSSSSLIRSQNARKSSPGPRAASQPAISRSTVTSSSSVGTRRNTGRAIAACGPEAAAQEDVVGLPPLPVLVAHGRALEAEVADPVMGAGVRAAVEVELQPGDLARRTAPPGGVTSTSIRVFVSVTEKLQCGSPVQAIAVARRRLTSSGKPISASAARVASTSASGTFVTDEVLLPRQADVAAEALRQVGDRDHLVAGDEPEMDGNADVREARLLLGVHADVVAERVGHRRRSKSASCRPSRRSTSARIPSGP